jgi:hypothetical protein
MTSARLADGQFSGQNQARFDLFALDDPYQLPYGLFAYLFSWCPHSGQRR